ncbi:apolipoprotein N-acyltransferase [Shimia biformata]|uniref:apolipoprotein N-acyltransferase n=1 Tax=Shimia biformata TaxID=1294299 RepID=UPI001EF1704E|nr:apolipoprotein N-acyltransferase [Shimia biformata]
MAETAPESPVGRPLPRWAMPAICLVLGAVTGLGQAPFNQPILTFLGLVLFFRLIPATRHLRTTALWALAFGAGYFLTVLHWIVEPFLVDIARHGILAPFALIFLSVGLALFWALAAVLTAWLGGGRWALVLWLTLAEMLRAYVFTGLPWGMVSQTLIDRWPGQMLALVGPHGVNLLMFFAAASLASMRVSGNWGQKGALAAIGVVLILPVSLPAPDFTGATVRLVQPNAPQRLKWHPDHVWTFYQRAYELTKGDGKGVDLVVWPETAIPSDLDAARADLPVIRAEAGDAVLVAGVRRFEGVKAYNSASVTDPDGETRQVYDKHHLVPFGEYLPFGSLLARFGLKGLAAEDGNGFSAGPGPVILDLGVAGTALPLICYEAVFPQDARTDERPDMLLQITNDGWFGSFSGPYQHLAQARMRAIEQGLPVLRAANTGVSAVIGPRGQLVAELPLNEPGFLDAAIPSALSPTLYARTGDGPLMVFLLVAATGLSVTARRKRAKVVDDPEQAN